MSEYYTATKNRSQGRPGWSVIFRHPARLTASGRPGKRIRRGLGTSDEGQADRLVTQLNQLLADNRYWAPSAREGLRGRFEELVLDIFYEGMEPNTESEPAAVRDELIPLPGPNEDFRTVMMLGTTGAGKTTLVRQLLGTDPSTERFPSTSAAKTTVSDIEVITNSSETYQAAVTFVGRDEVRDYLTECVTEAALAAFNGASTEEVTRRLLDHPDQRFRFSYTLGRHATPVAEDLDDDDYDDQDEADENPPSLDDGTQPLINLDVTAHIVKDCTTNLQRLVHHHGHAVKASLEQGPAEEAKGRAAEEELEDQIDAALQEDDKFHRIVDALFDEIEKRFALLTEGKVRRTRQGWPQSWYWATDDRAELLRSIARFSSNQAVYFGTLLTPLVTGIRVSGNFAPAWSQTPARLVVLDGEGLGHTPASASSLPTSVSKRMEQVDAVILVDNATQPMQAAPVAALHSIVATGNVDKLLLAFTHFDLVKGPNLPRFSDREIHVKASAENVLKSIGEDLGAPSERALRRRVDAASFFLSSIDETVDDTSKAGRRTVRELNRLIEAIDGLGSPVDPSESRPVYDRTNLILAVREAAENFHTAWQGRLGIEHVSRYPKEHWSRVKALSRRLALGETDSYDTLRPVSDLKQEIDQQIYRMLQEPIAWRGPEPDDEVRQQVIDLIAVQIAARVTDIATRRIRNQPIKGWTDAYAERGSGSTFRRAKIISDDVYRQAAPIPATTPSPDRNQFLHEVVAAFVEVADDLDVELR